MKLQDPRHVRCPAAVRDRHGARLRERREGPGGRGSTRGPPRGGSCAGRGGAEARAALV
jgi:hypothetical protein